MDATTLDPVFEDYVLAARKVCLEIQHLDLDKSQRLLSALIRLLCAANSLSECSIQENGNDLEISAVLPDALMRIPDDLVFNVVFDPVNPESICALSLKDALSDIYESLAGGLEVLDKTPGKKMALLWEWRQSYQFHWGRHLIDVIRFLFICK